MSLGNLGTLRWEWTVLYVSAIFMFLPRAKKRLVYGWLVWRSETFWLLISRHDHGPLKAWILPILSIATLIFGTQNFKL